MKIHDGSLRLKYFAGIILLIVSGLGSNCTTTSATNTLLADKAMDQNSLQVDDPKIATQIIPSLSSQKANLLSTNQPEVDTDKNTEQKFSEYELIQDMLLQIDKSRVRNDLELLTGERPICDEDGCYTITNRFTGSTGLSQAKDYVYKEFNQLGYEVILQDWSHSSYSDQNIIVRKPGVFFPDEEIIFVAHLDGVRSNPEKIYPAADDNASGVVDLIELARIINDYSFKKTLVLLISTKEEDGGYAVEYFVDHLTSSDRKKIKYVINIDMIGYDANKDGIMELWHGDHVPSLTLAERILSIIQTYPINLTPILLAGCG